MVWLCHNNFIFSKTFFTFFSLFCFYVSMKYFQLLLVAKWTEAWNMWWIFCLPYPHSFQIHLCALLCPSLCSGWGISMGSIPWTSLPSFHQLGLTSERHWKEFGRNERRESGIFIFLFPPCLAMILALTHVWA